MAKWRPSSETLAKIKRVRESTPEELRSAWDARGIDEIDPLTGDAALHAAVNAESPREVESLIRRGANLNTVNEMGLTPLMCACSDGGAAGMKIALSLIAAGADVNYVRQDDEMTALGFAACSSKPKVVAALLARGASVEGPPNAEQTPLMLAARENNVEAIKLLIAAGADNHRPCQLPWAQGKTALWLAEQEGATKAAKYLRGLLQ